MKSIFTFVLIIFSAFLFQSCDEKTIDKTSDKTIDCPFFTINTNLKKDSFKLTLVAKNMEPQDFKFPRFGLDPKYVREDYNFDGCQDFSLITECPSGGCFHKVFLFEPSKQKFFQSDEFSALIGLEVDKENQLLVSKYRGGWDTEVIEYFEVKKNRLSSVSSKEIFRWRQETSSEWLTWEKITETKMKDGVESIQMDSTIIERLEKE